MAEIDSSSAPPPALYDNPWRKPETTYEELVKEIEKIKPGCVANLLLLGPPGAGKSSAINSILSVVKGRRVNEACTGVKETSFTTKFSSFVNDGILKKCCLWDSMGIEQVMDGGGILLEDLQSLLKGHVKKDYIFKPDKKLCEEDPCYRKSPSIKDKIHCVVLVCNSTTVDALKTKTAYIQKIKKFQRELQTSEIPCVLVLTKIDLLCSKVSEDITKTFYSTKVHDAFKTATEVFCIPEGNTHPMKNYEVEIEVKRDTSILILLAVRQAMYFASDRIEKLKRDDNICTVC